MRLDIPSLLEKQYRFILVLCAGLVLVSGLAVMRLKAIDLDSGQTRSWWEIIRNVETGRGYKACNEGYVPNCRLTDQYTAIREPIPIYLFALVGWLTHDSVIALQLVQIMLVLTIMFGVFWLGCELGGPSVGSLAILMWTFYLPAMRLEVQITGDLLEGLFTVFGFLKFLHILRREQYRDWLAFGILFGLAALSRSAALILTGTLGFGYLVYVYMQKRNSVPVPKGWFKKAVISAIAFALILSPWVIRNWLIFGKPVVGTTLTGYVMYRHNAIIAKNVPPHFVGSTEALELVRELSVRRPALLTRINEAQINDLFMQEARSLVDTYPLEYIKLSVYRFIPLWFDIGVAEQYGQQTFIWDDAIILEQAILLVIFILGLCKRGWGLQLIGFSIIVYLVAYLAVQGQLRYTVPVSPGTIVIGSIGLLSGLPHRKS